jgi:hypothetical protein
MKEYAWWVWIFPNIYSEELMKEYGGVGPWIFPYTVLSRTHEKNMAGCVPGFSCTLYSVELIKEYAWWVWIFLYSVLSGTYEKSHGGFGFSSSEELMKEYGGSVPGFSSTLYSVELMKRIMVSLDFSLHMYMQRNLRKNMAGIGSLDFHPHIFFLYASRPSVEWGTVGNNYW